MEIERKFLLKTVPGDLENYPHAKISQAYLSRDPVIRVRQQDETYELTVKGKGSRPGVHEELNLPISREAYERLLEKAEGRVIEKIRYYIPLPPYTVELDRFLSPNPGLFLAEVEFPTEAEFDSFIAPDWFGEDVTEDGRYHNAHMAFLKD